jgi:hypothetical protein
MSTCLDVFFVVQVLQLSLLSTSACQGCDAEWWRLLTGVH